MEIDHLKAFSLAELVITETLCISIDLSLLYVIVRGAANIT